MRTAAAQHVPRLSGTVAVRPFQIIVNRLAACAAAEFGGRHLAAV